MLCRLMDLVHHNDPEWIIMVHNGAFVIKKRLIMTFEWKKL